MISIRPRRDQPPEPAQTGSLRIAIVAGVVLVLAAAVALTLF